MFFKIWLSLGKICLPAEFVGAAEPKRSGGLCGGGRGGA